MRGHEQRVDVVGQSLAELTHGGGDHGDSGREVLGELERGVVVLRADGSEDERRVHRREERREVAVFDRAREHGRYPPVARELFDARPLRTVADEEEGGSVDRSHGVDGLFDGVEAAEAADPPHHEPTLEAESGPSGRGVATGVEEIEVDPAGREQDAVLCDAEPLDLLGHVIGPARNEIRAPECGSLTVLLEPAAPPGPGRTPLLGLPDHRGGDEEHRRRADRAGEAQPGILEELVALPHEGDVAG